MGVESIQTHQNIQPLLDKMKEEIQKDILDVRADVLDVRADLIKVHDDVKKIPTRSIL